MNSRHDDSRTPQVSHISLGPADLALIVRRRVPPSFTILHINHASAGHAAAHVDTIMQTPLASATTKVTVSRPNSTHLPGADAIPCAEGAHAVYAFCPVLKTMHCETGSVTVEPCQVFDACEQTIHYLHEFLCSARSAHIGHSFATSACPQCRQGMPDTCPSLQQCIIEQVPQAMLRRSPFSSLVSQTI